MDSVSVQIVGGPDDGREYVVTGCPSEFNFAAMEQDVSKLTNLADYVSEHGPYVLECSFAMPIRLTRNGYRAYWDERRRR